MSGRIRIIFNRVDDNDDDNSNIHNRDIKNDTTEDSELKDNLGIIFSMLLHLKSESLQSGWNMNLMLSEDIEGPKIQLYAYGNTVGVMVNYVESNVGLKRELAVIRYTTESQMVEEFINSCTKKMINDISLNKMSPEAFRESILDMETRRNEHVKSKKNATPNMIERSDRILGLIQEYLK